VCLVLQESSAPALEWLFGLIENQGKEPRLSDRDASAFARFEWEDPPFGKELYLGSNDVLDRGVDRLTIHRDERGALTFTAKGTAYPGELSKRLANEIRPGVVSKIENRVDVNWLGEAGQLRDVLPWRWHERVRTHDVADVEVFGSLATFSACYSDEKAVVLTEWLVNVTDTFSWPDRSETQVRTTYRRSRGSLAVGPEATREQARLETKFERDHAEFTIRHLPGVIIQLGRANPSGARFAVRPGFITCKATSADLPDEGTRTAIRSCLGFMLGAELGYLGHTSFSADGRLVEQCSRHLSMVSGVDQVFENNARPPFRLANTDQGYGCYVDRDLFVRQIEGFLDAIETFDMRHILALYWYAEAASPYVAAVLYGSTLEAIRNEHENRVQPFPCNDDEVRGRWGKARKLAADAIGSLQAAGGLSEAEAERLTLTVESAHETSQRERWHKFFDALGLRTGPIEDRALKERNRPAHGIPYPEQEFTDAIRRVCELRTLCNRVLLKITNGSDTYIDYTTEGFPEREIGEPLRDGMK